MSRDSLYEQAAETYGSSLDRLARAYELDPEARRDLLQDIHLNLWRSFAYFDQRCSLRTWVYRVAHNIATGHVLRQRRINSQTLVGLEELEGIPDHREGEISADRRDDLELLLELVQSLKPMDRQIILSYLEGLDAASIAEITGISPGNVATKIHRIKSFLAERYRKGWPDDE